VHSRQERAQQHSPSDDIERWCTSASTAASRLAWGGAPEETKAGPAVSDAETLVATSETDRLLGRHWQDDVSLAACLLAFAGVAGVLAAGQTRGDLQAHLALARVAEQPPSSTPTSLLVRARTSTRPKRSRLPHRQREPGVCAAMTAALRS
jgi:hypothetical protein